MIDNPDPAEPRTCPLGLGGLRPAVRAVGALVPAGRRAGPPVARAATLGRPVTRGLPRGGDLHRVRRRPPLARGAGRRRPRRTGGPALERLARARRRGGRRRLPRDARRGGLCHAAAERRGGPRRVLPGRTQPRRLRAAADALRDAVQREHAPRLSRRGVPDRLRVGHERRLHDGDHRRLPRLRPAPAGHRPAACVRHARRLDHAPLRLGAPDAARQRAAGRGHLELPAGATDGDGATSPRASRAGPSPTGPAWCC